MFALSDFAKIRSTRMLPPVDLLPYPSLPVDLVSAFRAPRSGESVNPQPPLHTPVHHPSDPPHIDLFHRVRPRLDAGQKQNRLLNLRCQVGQPHAVCHVGGGDLSIECKLGLMLDHAVTNELVSRQCVTPPNYGFQT